MKHFICFKYIRSSIFYNVTFKKLNSSKSKQPFSMKPSKSFLKSLFPVEVFSRNSIKFTDRVALCNRANFNVTIFIRLQRNSKYDFVLEVVQFCVKYWDPRDLIESSLFASHLHE